MNVALSVLTPIGPLSSQYLNLSFAISKEVQRLPKEPEAFPQLEELRPALDEMRGLSPDTEIIMFDVPHGFTVINEDDTFKATCHVYLMLNWDNRKVYRSTHLTCLVKGKIDRETAKVEFESLRFARSPDGSFLRRP